MIGVIAIITKLAFWFFKAKLMSVALFQKFTLIFCKSIFEGAGIENSC
jgi:hypothetical protein